MIESLMSNPYAWCFLSLCTIISLIFGIYTWIVGNRIKEISIDYSTNDLIRQGESPIPQLNVTFDGENIQELSSTILYIWNSGNDVIDYNDIVSARPLKITCDSGKILDGKIIKQCDSSNDFTLSNTTSNEIVIKFSYMDGNDGVKIQVLHTGADNKLNFDCKIKGGIEIRDYTKIKRNKGIKGFWRGVMDETIPLIIFWFGFSVASLIVHIMNIQSEAYIVIVLILSIIIGVVFMLLYLKMKNKIRKRFHKTIPDLLIND